MNVSDALFTNLMGMAAIERSAIQAHKDWDSHFKGCASCRNFPKKCPTGSKLDEIATMWERQWERT